MYFCITCHAFAICSLVYLFVFFFSSRRRHTRCSRDWSSDVCSSDLGGAARVAVAFAAPGQGDVERPHAWNAPRGSRDRNARLREQRADVAMGGERVEIEAEDPQLGVSAGEVADRVGDSAIRVGVSGERLAPPGRADREVDIAGGELEHPADQLAVPGRELTRGVDALGAEEVGELCLAQPGAREGIERGRSDR